MSRPRTEKSRPKQTPRGLKFGCLRCGWIGRAARSTLDLGLPLCGNVQCAAYGQPMSDDFPRFMTRDGKSREAAYAVSKAAGASVREVTEINRLRDELNAALAAASSKKGADDVAA